jgi:hypothetical protein
MNPGFALGGIVLTVTLIVNTPAQNLGLGTGARSSVPIDSTMESAPGTHGGDRNETGAPPRKSQINRRLGLSARNYVRFNPRDFEARGRELQGRFYEIREPPAPGLKNDQGSPRGGIAQSRTGPSRQWMLWVGIAGAAGVSAGALGYYMMIQSHPPSAPEPIILNLSDDPLQP